MTTPQFSTHDESGKLQESGHFADERAAAKPFRDDIDIMGLERVAELAKEIVAAVFVTGQIRTVDEAAPGLMKSAGELGGSPRDSRERQVAHTLELMAILQTPEVLEKATRRIAARLWRDLDVASMIGKDERMLVRLIPAIVEMIGGPEQFAAGVRDRMEQAYPAKLQSVCEDIDAALEKRRQALGGDTPPA